MSSLLLFGLLLSDLDKDIKWKTQEDRSICLQFCQPTSLRQFNQTLSYNTFRSCPVPPGLYTKPDDDLALLSTKEETERSAIYINSCS